MSEEHKALGHRPPPGSLAAQAQAAATKHPKVPTHELTRAALEDAAKLEGGVEVAAVAGIDLNFIGEGAFSFLSFVREGMLTLLLLGSGGAEDHV